MKLVYNTKNILRPYLTNMVGGMSNKAKIHFYRAIIGYNTIVMNKNTELIDGCLELCDVGYSGKNSSVGLNKVCTIQLLKCRQTIHLLYYLAIKQLQK